MTRRIIPVWFTIVILLSSNSLARITLVPTHYNTIQEAIDVTRNGDTVVVAPGIYQENLRFSGKQIVVGSYILTIGGDVWIDETVIDGQDRGAVVTFSSEPERSILKGFTLCNGSTENGGGISCIGASPTLEDLKILHNDASSHGGGIAIIDSRAVMRRISINENSAESGGGGVYLRNSSPSLSRIQITSNRSVTGSGIFTEESSFTMERILVAGNSSEEDGAIELWGGNQEGDESIFDHITIADNYCGNGHSAGLILNTDTAEDINLSLRNSILWGNQGRQIRFLNGDNEWDGFSALIVRYCDIEDGRDSIVIGDRAEIDWGAGMIDEPPGFAGPETGDYRLSNDSPCIDAGEPGFARDPDGSRTDLGALWIWEPSIVLAGVALNSETNEPVPFAGGLGFSENKPVLIIKCDSLGVWQGKAIPRMDEFDIKITAVDFLEAYHSIEIPDVDSFWIETRLNYAEFTMISDTLSAVLDSGESDVQLLSIGNNGNGDLTWRSEVRNHGDSGLPPLTLRQQINAANITGDETLLAAVFDGEKFYIAGANGMSPNTIWIVDRENAVIGHFPQPGYSRLGFRDLEWDGEWIWGADEDTIYAFDREGNVQRRWRGPDQFNSFIAINPVNDIVWLSGATTDIIGFDLDGNDLGIALDRHGMRISGLGWLPDSAPIEGANVIVLQEIEEGLMGFTGINPHTGDTTEIGTLQVQSGYNLTGLSITQQYDRYAGSVMVILQNYPSEEWGDKLNIYQIQPNRQWAITVPVQGVIRPGESEDIGFMFHTAVNEFRWGLEGGTYTGDLVFTHDGRGGEFSIPVELEVIPPAGIDDEGWEHPDQFHITALYPSPFNATLTIEYYIPVVDDVTISLIDVTGRQIRELIQPNDRSGYHSVAISGKNLGSALYLVKLESSRSSICRKVVLLK